MFGSLLFRPSRQIKSVGSSPHRAFSANAWKVNRQNQLHIYDEYDNYESGARCFVV